MKRIEDIMKRNIEGTKEFLGQAGQIQKVAQAIESCFRNGNKLLIMGNGGSAADAQHIAGELVGRFKLERKGLPAIALTTDSSVMTAWANDYSFDSVFARQVEALARERDILLGLSTSGNSKNILKAFEKGREIGTYNISMTGGTGGELVRISDLNINYPSADTPRIQEGHMLAYHIICELVEGNIAN